MKEPIEIDETPITKTTFKNQGWEKKVETMDGEEYEYWILPLPKDNPDEDAVCLISSANDESEELMLQKGQYVIELLNMGGLGYCESEEEIELLYRSMTGRDIYDDTPDELSVK